MLWLGLLGGAFNTPLEMHWEIPPSIDCRFGHFQYSIGDAQTIKSPLAV